jgi:hypothetical protein
MRRDKTNGVTSGRAVRKTNVLLTVLDVYFLRAVAALATRTQAGMFRIISSTFSAVQTHRKTNFFCFRIFYLDCSDIVTMESSRTESSHVSSEGVGEIANRCISITGKFSPTLETFRDSAFYVPLLTLFTGVGLFFRGVLLCLSVASDLSPGLVSAVCLSGTKTYKLSVLTALGFTRKPRRKKQGRLQQRRNDQHNTF